LLVDLVRQLPAGEVTLEHRPEEGVVRVESGASQSRLNSYGVEDFPRLPGLEGAQTFTVAREPLLATVAQVSRAASRDESRPVLTGILVRLEAGRLVMAATDSYRLSVKETELGEGAPDFEAIVPARALGELARIAQTGDEIEMGLHENQVVFLVDGVTLTSRRIDGQFPNYRQLVPESFEHVVPVPRAELLEVVRRTAVIVQRNSPLRLRFAEGELTVSAQTQDVGESRETLPVAFDAEPLEIGFNAEFLREGIESVSGDELRLKLISPLRPAVLQGEGDDFTYLLMPIRLAG
jgi:DNA polymerase-3 subunit beta